MCAISEAGNAGAEHRRIRTAHHDDDVRLRVTASLDEATIKSQTQRNRGLSSWSPPAWFPVDCSRCSRRVRQHLQDGRRGLLDRAARDVDALPAFAAGIEAAGLLHLGSAPCLDVGIFATRCPAACSLRRLTTDLHQTLGIGDQADRSAAGWPPRVRPAAAPAGTSGTLAARTPRLAR